jgi:acyl carrier protein
MSENELIKLIRKTVQEWAQEEYDANEGDIPLKQRFKENWDSLIDRLQQERNEDSGNE